MNFLRTTQDFPSSLYYFNIKIVINKEKFQYSSHKTTNKIETDSSKITNFAPEMLLPVSTKTSPPYYI